MLRIPSTTTLAVIIYNVMVQIFTNKEIAFLAYRKYEPHSICNRNGIHDFMQNEIYFSCLSSLSIYEF